MKAVFSIFLMTIFFSVSAQNTSAFIRTYGGNDFNYGKGILALPDTSYIVCGNSNFNGSIGSIWLFRADSLGAFIWEKYINHYDAAIVDDIAWYDDTTFVICGTVLENSDYQIYVAKYSINGNMIWEKAFGTPSWDYGKSLVCDSAYNIWITGYSLPYDTFNTDAFIYTLNGINGDSTFYSRLDFSYTDVGTYIDTFASSLVLITTSTDINEDSCKSTFRFMDKNLNEKWCLYFGNDTTDCNLYCSGRDTYSRLWVAGGYQYNSATNESAYYALIDTSGIVIYEKHTGAWSSKYANRMTINNKSVVYTIGPTVDGILNFGNSDFGLVIDSSGFSSMRYYGELQNDYGEDIALTPDGGLVMIGSTESYAPYISSILLIKLDASLVYNDADHIHYTYLSENNTAHQIIAYPNPSNGLFSFNMNTEYYSYSITDLYGRNILEGNQLTANSIDISGETPGIYFISFKCVDCIRTIKLILQK